MQIQPYLFFNGRCEEALDFYRKALGAEIEMMLRFKDSPEAPLPGMSPPPEAIMHASFRVGASTVMASDGCGEEGPSFQGISLSLTAKDPAEAERLFAALSDGGQVQMPLGRTFFSPAFGVLADRFGVSWMVVVQPA